MRVTTFTVFPLVFLAGCATGPVLVAPEVTATDLQAARQQLARHELPASRDTDIFEMEDEARRVFDRIRPAIVATCREAFAQDPDCVPLVRKMRTKLVYSFSVNAYADSGDSTIGVHMGLMSSVGSDAELAWVLAHEAAHLLLGHGWKKEANSMVGAMLGAALGGAVGAGAYSPGMDPGYPGDVASAGFNVGQYLGYVAYSPEMELEADQFAVHVLRHANIRPSASLDMIVRLDRGAVPSDIRESGSGWAGFLDTHPANDRRLATMARLVADIDRPGQLLQKGQYLRHGSVPEQQQCAARFRAKWPRCRTYRGEPEGFAVVWRCGSNLIEKDPQLYRLCGDWLRRCYEDPATCQ